MLKRTAVGEELAWKTCFVVHYYVLNNARVRVTDKNQFLIKFYMIFIAKKVYLCTMGVEVKSMNMYKFGNYICKLREGKNLTQAELAGQLDVSDKSISKWENGGSLN